MLTLKKPYNTERSDFDNYTVPGAPPDDKSGEREGFLPDDGNICLPDDPKCGTTPS